MPDVAEEKEDYPEFKITWFSWRNGKKKLGKLKWWRPSDLLSMLSLVRNGIREAMRIARTEGIEYCGALWAIPSGYFAYRVKKNLGIPFSVWILGSDIWTYGSKPIFRNITKKVIKAADRIFSNSIYLREEVKRMFNRDGDILYAHRFLPMDATEAKLNKGLVNFLFIGRYEEVKGLDVLLKAFQQLLKEKQQVFLHVFGGGELEKVYIDMVNKLGLKGHVSINGFASPEIAVGFLKSCDCLVMPSRRESQPVLLMDAIQTKTPVIVSTAGDMADIVRRFDVGEVVKIEDVIALKDAMMRFIDKGGSGYKKALENAARTLNVDSMAKNYIKGIR